MRTIEIKVMDDLVTLYGIEAIKKMLEAELEYQRFRFLENRIQKALSDTDVDWEKEFELKREEAFDLAREFGLKGFSRLDKGIRNSWAVFQITPV